MNFHFYAQDQLLEFPMEKSKLFLFWTNFTQNDTGVHIRYLSNWMEAEINVTRDVILETMSTYKRRSTGVTRLDNFVNIMVSH